LKVFADTYNENSSANQPVTLTAGKALGFGVSYNDNDGGSSRENFIGSMEISGTDKNVAYKNASVFGKLQLVTAIPTVTPAVTPRVSQTPLATLSPNPTATVAATVASSVSYTMNDWGSGATVSVTIKNNGTAPINGWSLVWNFPGNQKISNIWNASYTQSGTKVTVTNQAYNSTIGAGGTTSFGFNITYSGSNAKPIGFTLNGASCETY
jgi:cellulase/cellobiase CelA1